VELEEVKKIVDAYKIAGKSRDETSEMVSALPLNGDQVKAFEYVDEVFNLKDGLPTLILQMLATQNILPKNMAILAL
jgi:hypothetical protein